MPDFSPDLLGLSAILGIGLGIFISSVIGRTIYLLTHPTRRTYAAAVARERPGDPSEIPAPDGPLQFEEWILESRNLKLPVWDIRGRSPVGPVVILSHGWGDSRIGALSRIPELARLASRVIAWDLPGHGESTGTCSLGTREVDDLLALLARIREPNSRIVLYGWSLGAGVSIAAAARDVRERPFRIDAVIAEAPYRLAPTPARNVLRQRRLPSSWNVPPAFWLLGLDFKVGPSWLRKGGFDRAVLAGRLQCPLLVIHGYQDEICPVDDGRQIAAAAKDGKIAIIEGAGHFGLWTDEAHAGATVAAVTTFLARV
ncbi:MAG: alpha/beta fold hydrolase [Phycisphaerales bacterium]|nr:alpha/beta fold hydrolase [Phycisphaerales bacterium]